MRGTRVAGTEGKKYRLRKKKYFFKIYMKCTVVKDRRWLEHPKYNIFICTLRDTYTGMVQVTKIHTFLFYFYLEVLSSKKNQEVNCFKALPNHLRIPRDIKNSKK